MPEAELYLFDGYNLLHQAGLGDRRELVDALASYVALRGARGVVVFDGVGEDARVGALDVRFAEHADDLLERLAAENRGRAAVAVVTSDRAILGTAGQESRRVSSKTFLRELAAAVEQPTAAAPTGTRVGDALDPATRKRLERWRRQNH